MKAVLPATPGDPTPRVGDCPEPATGPGEVLIAVAAAGINWADLLQLRGLYPPPAGAGAIPGLECSGLVAEVGAGVEGFRRGDRVMALLAGGGQAERVAVPAGQVMPLPENLGFADGGALPEAGITAWTNLVAEGGLRAGETVLVTGAGGGMGTMMVQVASALGARVLAAGREPSRLEPVRDLGAEAICRLGPELAEEVRRHTAGRGADLVVDLVGGAHFGQALGALRPGGRLVLVGLLAGARCEVDLGLVLRRQLRVAGSLLRPRPVEEKAALVRDFAAFALPRLRDGRLRAMVDRVMPLGDAAAAYAALAAGGVHGKIVLDVTAG